MTLLIYFLGSYVVGIFFRRFKTADKSCFITLYDEIDEMYGCTRLRLTDQYTCVYLDLVDVSVHIIPRNNCDNEYFVNKYIF